MRCLPGEVGRLKELSQAEAAYAWDIRRPCGRKEHSIGSGALKRRERASGHTDNHSACPTEELQGDRGLVHNKFSEKIKQLTQNKGPSWIFPQRDAVDSEALRGCPPSQPPSQLDANAPSDHSQISGTMRNLPRGKRQLSSKALVGFYSLSDGN